ncbi:hypothetical protein HYW43_03800 [Candidatus Daviesbacteria bacterium]|nr:hypothetical protein [Candidatus Daviesbacteria bacterium]
MPERDFNFLSIGHHSAPEHINIDRLAGDGTQVAGPHTEQLYIMHLTILPLG